MDVVNFEELDLMKLLSIKVYIYLCWRMEAMGAIEMGLAKEELQPLVDS